MIPLLLLSMMTLSATAESLSGFTPESPPTPALLLDHPVDIAASAEIVAEVELMGRWGKDHAQIRHADGSMSVVPSARIATMLSHAPGDGLVRSTTTSDADGWEVERVEIERTLLGNNRQLLYQTHGRRSGELRVYDDRDLARPLAGSGPLEVFTFADAGQLWLGLVSAEGELLDATWSDCRAAGRKITNGELPGAQLLIGFSGCSTEDGDRFDPRSERLYGVRDGQLIPIDDGGMSPVHFYRPVRLRTGELAYLSIRDDRLMLRPPRAPKPGTLLRVEVYAEPLADSPRGIQHVYGTAEVFPWPPPRNDK